MRKCSVMVMCVLGACGGPDIESTRQAVCNPGGDCCGSPIVLDLAGDGVQLTSPADGVSFSLRPGSYRRYAWTKANSDDAWLALDRDRNGMIDNGSELFGNFTEQYPMPEEIKNGFVALRDFDEHDDGVIDARDRVFPYLLLWQDRNHDGVSQPNELSKLADHGISGISTNYLATDWTSSANVDSYGNLFAFYATVYRERGSTVDGRAFDVYLDSVPDPLINIADAVGLKARILPIVRAAWACSATCLCSPSPPCPAGSTGHGNGGNETNACNAAITDAVSNCGSGCTGYNCSCSSCTDTGGC